MNTPQKSIFFTGASGRVGRRVIPVLQKKYPIMPVDLVRDSKQMGRLCKIDLTNREEVVEGFKDASAIVHCAIASHGNPDCEQEELAYNERMIEVNVRGTYNIYEAARIHRIPRVVFISSLTTSLGKDHGHQYCPKMVPSPVNLYACTKLFGENLAEVYHQEFGVNSIILRLGQPYPMGLPQEKEWVKDKYSSSLFVTFPDIARAIEAGLSSEIPFGRYNVVSLHQEARVTVENGKEIGFQPMDVWTPSLAPVPILKVNENSFT